MVKTAQRRKGVEPGEQSPVKRRKKESEVEVSRIPTVNVNPPTLFIPSRTPQFSPRYKLQQSCRPMISNKLKKTDVHSKINPFPVREMDIVNPFPVREMDFCQIEY